MSEHLYDTTTVPRLGDEFALTLADWIRGTEPNTVTGVLLASEEPLTREGIAAALGLQTTKVEGIVVALQEEGWLREIVENGLSKLVITAPVQSPQQVSAL